MAKIGILGGTFNPPHLGHLIIAEEVLMKQSLDEIWFMPNSQPPHKKANTSAEDRVKMVQLATKSHAQFHVCTIELELEGPSYTTKTMKELQAKYPEHQFYFIIGADSVENLQNWYAIEELLKLVTFIAVKRPGYQMKSPFRKQLIEVDAPIIAISSSDIRNRIANGENYTYLTVETVRQYMEEHGLYGAK